MPLFVKLILLFVFVLIFFSMGKALLTLLRGGDTTDTVKALTWRVGLSIALFVLILMLFAFDIIKPHALFQ